MGHVLNQALLIEDEADVRAFAAERLEDLGYEVHTARDGEEGIQLLKNGLRASLILVDLFMPNLDAVGFRRQQVSDPRLADIPTVVMTTTRFAGVVAGSIGLPLLKKPFDREQLAAAVKDAEARAPAKPIRSSWL